jgi:hypothetical protein
MATKALGNMITNTEDENLRVAGNQNLGGDIVWMMARVEKDGAITSPKSKNYAGVSSLGGIKFESLGNNINNISGGVAQSLFPHIIVPPLEGEVVLILQNKSNSGGFEFYYISSLNLYNNGSYNPDVPVFRLDEHDNIPLGEGLSETNLDKLRKLFLSPGDISLEGRFGNTIHLGNSNTDTPYKGKQNSPITIIRNGQREVDSLDPIFEDINKDNSSIYLTRGQTIPIDVISKNMQTFEGKTSTTITYDNTIIFNLSISGEDNSTQSDIKPVVDNKRDNANTSKEYREGDHDAGDDVEENVAGISDEESDQVFTPINSPKYISIQPTSDPTYT